MVIVDVIRTKLLTLTAMPLVFSNSVTASSLSRRIANINGVAPYLSCLFGLAPAATSVSIKALFGVS